MRPGATVALLVTLTALAGCAGPEERHQVEMVSNIDATGPYEIWIPVPLDAHSAKSWVDATAASPYFGAAEVSYQATDKGAVMVVNGQNGSSLEGRFQQNCCFDGFNTMEWSTQADDEVWIWADQPTLVSINYVGTSCQDQACEGGTGITCWIEARIAGNVGTGWTLLPASLQRGCDG